MSKNKFLKGFGIVVIFLALVRCVFPSIAQKRGEDGNEKEIVAQEKVDSTAKTDQTAPTTQTAPVADSLETLLGAKPVPRSDQMVERNGVHPIVGVISYSKTFPDSNDVQLESAMRLGVTLVRDREEAEQRKNELVYVGANPYCHVEKLTNSIPYLVPRAAVLLNDIGRNFFDSLYVKNIPLHKFVVTSVLRTQRDLDNLKMKNGNASENSCHLYGTTFDIGYNRYQTVSDPDGPQRRMVANDTLKWVLCEVVRDLREQGRCFVKYEVKQGCLHITTR